MSIQGVYNHEPGWVEARAAWSVCGLALVPDQQDGTKNCSSSFVSMSEDHKGTLARAGYVATVSEQFEDS